MRDRRKFVTAAVCAAIALTAATGRAGAQTAVSPFTRTTLGTIAYPDDQHLCLQQLLEAPATRPVARLTHPGVEATTVISGSFLLSVEGKPDRLVKAGESFFIAPYVPHSGRTGPDGTRMVATFFVEKGKPLVAPAP